MVDVQQVMKTRTCAAEFKNSHSVLGFEAVDFVAFVIAKELAYDSLGRRCSKNEHGKLAVKELGFRASTRVEGL